MYQKIHQGIIGTVTRYSMARKVFLLFGKYSYSLESILTPWYVKLKNIRVFLFNNGVRNKLKTCYAAESDIYLCYKRTNFVAACRAYVLACYYLLFYTRETF